MPSMHVHELALLVRDVSYTVAIGWVGGCVGFLSRNFLFDTSPGLCPWISLLSLPLHSGSLISPCLSFLAELGV